MLMNREKLLVRSSPIIFPDGAPNEAKWEEWIRIEARTRTGYCIWVNITPSWLG